MTEFKHSEDEVWNTIDPEHIWVMDKLIHPRKLGYSCGPNWHGCSQPDWYIVLLVLMPWDWVWEQKKFG